MIQVSAVEDFLPRTLEEDSLFSQKYHQVLREAVLRRRRDEPCPHPEAQRDRRPRR